MNWMWIAGQALIIIGLGLFSFGINIEIDKKIGLEADERIMTCNRRTRFIVADIPYINGKPLATNKDDDTPAKIIYVMEEPKKDSK